MTSFPHQFGRRAALCGIAGTLLGGAVADAQQRSREKLKEPVFRVAAKNENKAVPKHPLDQALEMAKNSLLGIQKNVDDYTCVLIKRERVGGKLGAHEYVFTKIRNHKESSSGKITQPLSVYMYFLKPTKVKGREVIYVEGKNRGRLTAHETSRFLPTVSLDPNSLLAMRGQLYPITDIGIENLVKKLIDRGNKERKSGNCDVTFNHDAKFNGRPCTVLEVKHPEKRQGLEFYVAQVFIDKELNVPIRYVAYDFPKNAKSAPPILEEYNYTQLKLNVGLKDIDFDTKNKDYNF